MAKQGNGKGGRGGTIVIKREEIVEGGHHGGAWKVAYADFVTAMMAFFLLMWLLNATTEEQRRGIADYFAVTSPFATGSSGSGQPFGGKTPFDSGNLVSDRGAQTIKPGKSTAMVAPDDADADTSAQMVAPRMIDDDGDPASAQLARTAAGEAVAGDEHAGAAATTAASPDPAQAAKEQQQAQAQKERQQARVQQERQERVAFQNAAEQIRDAVRADPALAPLAHQLSIDMTPEGLRIQVLDEDKLPMFATGSSALNDRAKLLLQKVAPILARLPEAISITGHTDAAPYRGTDKSNWELSSERANATRRLLVDAGLQEARFRSVAGDADRDLLLPADPLAAANRRIAIVVLKARAGAPAVAPSPPTAPNAGPRAP